MRTAPAAQYEDKSGMRRKELMSITGSQVFEQFYERLKRIRSYHGKFPGASMRIEESSALKVSQASRACACELRSLRLPAV